MKDCRSRLDQLCILGSGLHLVPQPVLELPLYVWRGLGRECIFKNAFLLL